MSGKEYDSEKEALWNVIRLLNSNVFLDTEQIKSLQESLRNAGYTTNSDSHGIDGILGEDTQSDIFTMLKDHPGYYQYVSTEMHEQLDGIFVIPGLSDNFNVFSAGAEEVDSREDLTFYINDKIEHYVVADGDVMEDDIRALQSGLKNLGLYDGKIDGDFGPQSSKALMKHLGENQNLLVEIHPYYFDKLMDYGHKERLREAAVGVSGAAERVDSLVKARASADLKQQFSQSSVDSGVDPAFEKAMAFTFKWEGGHADHKNDRGGATHFGITSKYYPEEYQKVDELLKSDGEEAARAYARAFYKREFFDKVVTADMNEAQALAVFDSAVHHGQNRARRLWERSGGDIENFIDRRAALMERFARHDPSQQDFIQGWRNRIADLRVETADLSSQLALHSDMGDTLQRVMEPLSG